MTAKSPFTTLIFNVLPLAEKIFMAGIGVGLVLLYLELDTNLAFISLNGIAVVYFLYAYKPPESKTENKPSGFVALMAFSTLPKVMWISCSISVTGIMFHLLALAGAPEMILIGLSAIGVGLFLFAIFFMTGVVDIKSNIPILSRMIPLLIVDLYLTMPYEILR